MIYKKGEKSRELSKKEVLFATTNPAKIEKYKYLLEEQGIELITINDLDYELEIEENGKDAIQNARIKAKAYFEKTKIPTIGMDNCLFIEDLPEENQPGTHVRRVNGKRLTDEEMIEYYSNLASQYGGRLKAKWVYGMVIFTLSGEKQYSWSKDHFYFVDKPCKERKEGYPLDSISIEPKSNKYWLELTEKEKDEININQKIDDAVVDFIVKSLK